MEDGEEYALYFLVSEVKADDHMAIANTMLGLLIAKIRERKEIWRVMLRNQKTFETTSNRSTPSSTHHPIAHKTKRPLTAVRTSRG